MPGRTCQACEIKLEVDDNHISRPCLDEVQADRRHVQGTNGRPYGA